jgi:phosphoketolase
MGGVHNPRVAVRTSELVHHYEYVLVAFRRYIEENGVDPEEISDWHWHGH